jgi:GNAT superfamily N-acetyltransferase
MNGIEFRSAIDGIVAEQLSGFFVDWPEPPSLERHLEILTASHGVELAIDTTTNCVVGFINVISDGVFSAFIPLLEVLPEYQGRGIGGALIDRIVARYRDLYMLDLCCDERVVSVYESRDFIRVVGMVRRNYSAISSGNTNLN